MDARALSRQHAEFQLGNGGMRRLTALRLTDPVSTNGTFVNRGRIEGECTLAENDIIDFGNAEYRLGVETATPQHAVL